MASSGSGADGSGGRQPGKGGPSGDKKRITIDEDLVQIMHQSMLLSINQTAQLQINNQQLADAIQQQNAQIINLGRQVEEVN